MIGDTDYYKGHAALSPRNYGKDPLVRSLLPGGKLKPQFLGIWPARPLLGKATHQTVEVFTGFRVWGLGVPMRTQYAKIHTMGTPEQEPSTFGSSFPLACLSGVPLDEGAVYHSTFMEGRITEWV